jgi:hypothetical protein
MDLVVLSSSWRKQQKLSVLLKPFLPKQISSRATLSTLVLCSKLGQKDLWTQMFFEWMFPMLAYVYSV